MIFLYAAALLLPPLTWWWTGRAERSPDRAPWPEWTPRRVAVAAALAGTALVAAVVRVMSPYRAAETCDYTFADTMNASVQHGLAYFEAVFVLSIPLMTIAVLRRRASWAAAAVVLLVTAVGSCYTAMGAFDCPDRAAVRAVGTRGSGGSDDRLVAQRPSIPDAAGSGTSRTLP